MKKIDTSYNVPPKNEVVKIIKAVNDHWISVCKDPGEVYPGYTNEPTDPANGWAYSIYMRGNMAAYEATGEAAYYEYAKKWADKYKWGPLHYYKPNTDTLNEDALYTVNADSQCCFITYYALAKHASKEDDWSSFTDPLLENLHINISHSIESEANTAWSWVDAIFMIAQLYGDLYQETSDRKYLEKLYAMYDYPLKEIKRSDGGYGLFEPIYGLWYRDENFGSERLSNNGKPILWGRGNGWGYAATAQILERIPKNEPQYKEYMKVFLQMSETLRSIQSKDGLWRTDMLNPVFYDKPETSGSSLFTLGMIIGIKNGWLSEEYMDCVNKAWTALTTIALADGNRIGWSQPGGASPSTAFNENTTKCFTTGAFLMAASELAKL